MILLLKNLLFTVLVPGFFVGWLPLRWLERPSSWPDALNALHLAGLFLAATGAAAYIHCLGHFIRRGHGTPAPIDPPKRLVQRGLYRWVRNPMYWAMLLIVLGEALFLQSGTIALYALVLACVFQLIVVLHEEPALSFRFGAMYDDYKRAVPRWWPRRPPNDGA